MLFVLSRSASYRRCRYCRNTHSLNHSWALQEILSGTRLVSHLCITNHVGSRSHECHFCETTISPLKSSPKYAPKNLGAIPDIFPKTLGNSTYWTYIVMGKNMLGIEESAVSMAAAKVAKP